MHKFTVAQYTAITQFSWPILYKDPCFNLGELIQIPFSLSRHWRRLIGMLHWNLLLGRSNRVMRSHWRFGCRELAWRSFCSHSMQGLMRFWVHDKQYQWNTRICFCRYSRLCDDSACSSRHCIKVATITWMQLCIDGTIVHNMKIQRSRAVQ